MDTPDRILTEAEQLFAEHGFAGTRLAAIASAAGLGNAGLLHHFPSKAVLYRAVLESIAADLDGRSAGGDPSIEPVERMRELIGSLLSLHRDRPAAVAIIAHEFLDRSGRIEDADVLPLEGVVADTVSALAAGQRDGSIRPGDPVAMTAALHGAVIIGALGRTVYQRTTGMSSADDWDGELARSALATVAAGR